MRLQWLQTMHLLNQSISCLITHSQPLIGVKSTTMKQAEFSHYTEYMHYYKSFDSSGILFSLKAFWIHTNSLSLTYKSRGWPLQTLNSVRVPRPVYLLCRLFVAAWPPCIAKSRSIWYYNKSTPKECGSYLLVERWGKRLCERQAARCHQCREMGVKRMKTYKWKSIREGRKA